LRATSRGERVNHIERSPLLFAHVEATPVDLGDDNEPNGRHDWTWEICLHD
jgi:hypothetical protein